MLRQRLACVLAAAAFALASSSSALADKLLYDIGSGSSVSAYDPPSSNNGLEIHHQLKSGLNNITFELDDGESYWFPFFDIWTPETTVNSDDLNEQSITATLDFDIPDVDATMTGETYGVSLFGIIQAGVVTWNSPAIITTSDRTFKVQLSDGKFNLGLFGLTEGEGCGTTIKAKVTQYSSTTTNDPPIVPTPTAAMGGFVLIGGMLTLGRRRLSGVAA